MPMPTQYVMKFIIQYCQQLSIGYALARKQTKKTRERGREIEKQNKAIHIWDVLNRVSHFVFGNLTTIFFGGI